MIKQRKKENEMGILVTLAVVCVLFGILAFIGFDLDWGWLGASGFIVFIFSFV